LIQPDLRIQTRLVEPAGDFVRVRQSLYTAEALS
jgi:hypothetical protein